MLVSKFVKMVEEAGFGWKKQRRDEQGIKVFFGPGDDFFYSKNDINNASEPNVTKMLKKTQKIHKFDVDYDDLPDRGGGDVSLD